jgi:mono/diheme cytochrome c family protein
MKNFIGGIIFALLALLVGGFLYLKKGYVSLAADQEPSFVERTLAMAAVDASTERHALDLNNPVPATEKNLIEGAKLFYDNCAGCHGMSSSAVTQFGRSFYPPAPAFFKDVPDMPESQNFYIIQHGIRWTGMPAWNKTLSETQVWQLVTFLSHIQKLPPAALKKFEPPMPGTR